MTTIPEATPANTLDEKDPGDDVQRRFRYQAAYTAILALELLDEDSEFAEIFCEHHEDTLVKKNDGTFIGVQVKTRAAGKNPFKSDDEQIRHAITRFIEQTLEYPHCYSRFVLATNYAFWNEKNDDAKNLSYLIQLAQEAMAAKTAQLKRPLANYVNDLISRVNSGRSATRDVVLDVLSKVVIQDNNLPKFDDIESRLTNHIPEFYDVGEARHVELLNAAKRLIGRMFEAASLSHVSAKQMYFALCANPAQERIDAEIEGKRITRETVRQILHEALSTDTLLRTNNPILLTDLPRGMRKLALKMAKGGISVANINRAKDHKFSYETLYDTWILKYGNNLQKAKDRYHHLSVMVGNECQEAYDLASQNGEPFGQTMLNDIRLRLRERLRQEPESFLGCQYEQLLGVAGTLTELCNVWWSEEFEIPEENV